MLLPRIKLITDCVLSVSKKLKLNENWLNVVRTNLQWRMQGKGSRQNIGKSKTGRELMPTATIYYVMLWCLYLFTLELLSNCTYAYLQSRPTKKLSEWQSRSKTTTPALKTAAVTATKIAEDVCQVEQGAQGSSTSPVCAYNEWDPLEVVTFLHDSLVHPLSYPLLMGVHDHLVNYP